METGKLSAASVKSLVAPGRYGDGGGLWFQVQGVSQRSWLFRYMLNGRAREMGLGPYPDISLAVARDKARVARDQLREKVDPIEARRASQVAIMRAAEDARERSFKTAADDLLAAKEGSWRNAKHKAQWRSTLETYAYPVLGSLPVAAIDTDAVLKVLQPIWKVKPETASRLRGRIEAVLDGARARGWRTGENPARWKGHLSELLAAPHKLRPVEHHPALPWRDVGPFIEDLRAIEGTVAAALEFTILTAARSGEVRGARWGEIDLNEAVWLVPASRMKAGKAHRVPLSGAAVTLLRRLMPANPARDALVFPGAKAGKPLSDMALTMLLRRMGHDTIRVHGFRSTFRVWAAECRPYPREVVEAALAHVLKDKAEAAYARTDLLERRRPLMEEWAQWCGRGRAVGEVVALGRPIAAAS